MLMFISFPVIADEWVELGSLAFRVHKMMRFAINVSKV